ncbi:Beta-galactosidase/beta-glucuronidase [Sinomicrobium oceani]|uniref:beta-galactosidase n=1 Tax=Sinomicrobium oceani TaxID=1150368 RepID=A0A1K1PXG0_9FLAO|nr:glycoside hydrolase family 2 TIM barrel-domain containing protein [Sinomicrobium oceani]SFW52169.1 Beta-galactosidase/beta-glucuronidase [Sinomicrobium oceani]
MRRLFLLHLVFCIAIQFPLYAQQEKTTQRLYLSGKGYQDTETWEFKISDGRNGGTWSTIEVPSVWEQQGFGKYQYGIKFYGKPHPEGIADEVGEYKYKFTVPKGWENQRVKIVFDGSMTDTEVRINGRKAGDKHQGAFYRFQYDISGLLKYGKENLLEVTVSKESENGSVNLAERRADYWNFGGIFRPVFLEARPAYHIDRTAVKAEADGSFEADVFLGEGATGLRAEAVVTDVAGKKKGVLKGEAVPGSDRIRLSGTFEDIALWTAETPNLYHVDFLLYRGDELLHKVSDRFGFRTIEIHKGDGIYVNGQRVLMKGVNRHSFWPESGRTLNKELNYADVRLIKEMNMNAVRLSHYPPDPEFLDACDELGLYVMDELGGWHGHYDDAVGKKLVREMVTRDLNHPCIIFWSNGNEGGWNTNLDNQFEIWDLQKRPVLHPQQELSGVETMHYRSYGETLEYFRGEEIFMPTEFLHGLYDGGHGAGLFDYWEVMRKHPRSGGGYLWVYADEGIARTDQGGRIDNQGNYAADGIVGPHHEKEGSFYTIKEVWSPVVVLQDEKLPEDFDGVFTLENRYDFTNTNQCTIAWELAAFPAPGDKSAGHKTITGKTIKGPDIAPHAAGELQLKLPSDWKKADVLYLKAQDPEGKELWTWSYTWDKVKKPVMTEQKKEAAVTETAAYYEVSASGTQIRIDRKTGKLLQVWQSGKKIAFGNGPRFIAARRGDRTLDGTVDKEAAKGEDRIYKEIAYEEKLRHIAVEEKNGEVTVTAGYFGPLQQVRWTVKKDGTVQLDYDYEYHGIVELVGVSFDYPEDHMEQIRWLGKGPYRVWQNRLHGTTLDVWENEYNDPVPGESFVYPEFKGYFDQWRWAVFRTSEGEIRLRNGNPGSYLGVYTPRDGRDALLYTLPQTGIAVFDVIPAVRNKVNATDLVGPSSQPQWIEGRKKHTLYLEFKTD